MLQNFYYHFNKSFFDSTLNKEEPYFNRVDNPKVLHKILLLYKIFQKFAGFRSYEILICIHQRTAVHILIRCQSIILNHKIIKPEDKFYLEERFTKRIDTLKGTSPTYS